MIPKGPLTGHHRPLGHAALSAANAAPAGTATERAEAGDVKPPAEALWPDAPLPVARHVLAQAVDCRLPASPDTERVGSLFRQVAQRAAAAGAGIDRGGWRRVPCALDVIAGALPSSLLQIALKNGHTFRPTLVGRMDSAPEKVRLVSAFLGALCDAHAGRTCIVGSSTTAARVRAGNCQVCTYALS